MTDAKVPIGWSEEGHHKLLAATTVEELADALTSEMKRHTAGVTLVCGEGPDTQFIVDSSATTDGPIFNGTIIEEQIKRLSEKSEAAIHLAFELLDSGLIVRIRMNESGPKTPLETWLSFLGSERGIEVYPPQYEDSDCCS